MRRVIGRMRNIIFGQCIRRGEAGRHYLLVESATFLSVAVFFAPLMRVCASAQDTRTSLSSESRTDLGTSNSYGTELTRNSGSSSPVAEFYEQAIQSNPQAKDLHFQLGLQFWDERRIAEAELQFLEELRLDPQCYRARLMLGMAALEEEKNNEAVEYLETAVLGDATLKQAYLPLGKAWFRLGSLEKAREALETAAQVEPGLPPVYSLQAQVYSRLKRQEDAARMRELDSRARDLRSAESFAAVEDWNRALQLVSTYLSAFPDSSRGLYIKGLILFNGYRKIGEATQVLQQAILKNPANVEGRRLLGIVDWVAGNKRAFEEEMNLVLAADPLDARAHYYWGRYAFENGRYQEAREHLERARRFSPSDERVATSLALTYEELGLSQEAEKQHVAAVSLAMKKDTPDPWVYLNYGAFLLNVNRASEALPLFKKATTFRRVHPKAYYLTGVAYARTGRCVEAAKYFERALAADPRWAEPRAALAEVYDRLGKTQEAAAQRAVIAKLAAQVP